MLKLNHKKLDVWKLSVEFTKQIYSVTESFPKSEMFGISNQLRRASVSVSSNLAEGAARKSAAERKRFFEMSRSSIVEIDTQIEIFISLGYIGKVEEEMLSEIINHMFAMISNLISKS